ncbi:MAG: transposase zinc-binding domain-containing protein [Bacteroidota bacterium]|nr:transposase zinc-binding domain-containing protein [Bacteroidota bacterium]
MEQSLSERRQLLQTKIFAHPSVAGFNPYSQAVLSRLSRCHTSAIGVHHYRCSNEACRTMHYQYHPSFIGTVATGIVLVVAV